MHSYLLRFRPDKYFASKCPERQAEYMAVQNIFVSFPFSLDLEKEYFCSVCVWYRVTLGTNTSMMGWVELQKELIWNSCSLSPIPIS